MGLGAALLLASAAGTAGHATGPAIESNDDFARHVLPVLERACVECHSGPRPKARLDLSTVRTREGLLSDPERLELVLDVVAHGDMPPEDGPQLAPAERQRMAELLEGWLVEATADAAPARVPIRRLNRFQYASAVRDLFELRLDVFPLPEKLMTRHGAYLSARGPMPERVQVSSDTFAPPAGLREVEPFPKDLRAAHGFDNQADRLTLSPLLLDTLLRLALSIVESPDFTPENVGVWERWFATPPPAPDGLTEEEGREHQDSHLRSRIEELLTRAFRRDVDPETLERYVAHARARLAAGEEFSLAMRGVAAAALSSPRFLFHAEEGSGEPDPFDVAARLSFFLWSSGPDGSLLEKAADGSLGSPEVLEAEVERMLGHPRIERFLDTFPTQWLQLENVLAATPDPDEYPAFNVAPGHPAGLQMLLEPLLLFDAVFVEDRPVVELLAPEFTYRSRFLEVWYESDLRPDPVDPAWVEQDNAARTARIAELEGELARRRAEAEALAADLPVRLATAEAAIDLGPGLAAWTAEQRELLRVGVTSSTWHRIGPFPYGTFDEAHATDAVDPEAIDLEAPLGELSWEERADWVDGTAHELVGANSATYLRRTLHVQRARPVELRLGTDDSFKLWLNGKLIAENKITRGVAPDQDRVNLELEEGENELLLKVVNGGGGYGFHFQTEAQTLPAAVIAALEVEPDLRDEPTRTLLADHYFTLAPELAPVREQHAKETVEQDQRVAAALGAFQGAPKPRTIDQVRADQSRAYDDHLRHLVRQREFIREPVEDPRYGGVITNAAMLSMTSGPDRTHPIARGAWIIEAVLNDPPPPPPNDVPPLNEDDTSHLTIREQFARHRADPACAGCHERLDPLGFALENYDTTGRWRDRYPNEREVDASGRLFREHDFSGAVEFKRALVEEERRFVTAFTAHLLRYAAARELGPADRVTVTELVDRTEQDGWTLRSLLRAVALERANTGP